LARAQDVMQTRLFRGSGDPARVSASSNACFRLGPDPRRALGPAVIRAASTGRTHHRTRPMLIKALVDQAPSTRDPKDIERTETPTAAVSSRISCVAPRSRSCRRRALRAQFLGGRAAICRDAPVRPTHASAAKPMVNDERLPAAQYGRVFLLDSAICQ
jgi:hypothetical protein